MMKRFLMGISHMAIPDNDKMGINSLETESELEMPGDGDNRETRNDLVKYIIAAIVIVCIALSLTGLYFFCTAISDGTDAANQAYTDRVEKKKDEIYKEFYNDSFTLAEREYHVKNRVSAMIDSIQEQNKLEVLQISEVEYIVASNENKKAGFFSLPENEIETWLEVPGYGVYTVDLNAGEFIVDDERQFILIRLPRPVLSHLTVDDTKIQILHFAEKGFRFSNSGDGVKLADEQLKIAENRLNEKALANQKAFKAAEENTKFILTSLVRQIDPNNKNIKVEIEFIN